jgi:Ca2+-binding RTX toxin-like protein
MPDIQVATTAALMRALASAKSGDQILLASGTYAGIDIRNLHVAGNVTIKSADPAHRAVISDISFRDSSGITVSNVEMATSVANSKVVYAVYGSTDIHFDRVEVHGPAGLGSLTTVAPFVIRDSNNVTVTNSEFHDLQFGIGLRDTTDVKISGTYFHDMRTDGIRGGGNSDLSISGNFFTDFTPAEGDHADAIQLWTTGIDTVARNISITDNLVVRGSGAPIQGIFIRDTADNLPFENVTITGNLVAGGNYNAISVDGVNGATIADNTVAGFADRRSWLRVENGTNVALEDNKATYYIDEASQISASNNAILLDANDSGASAVYGWLTGQGQFVGGWGNAANAMADAGLVYTAAMAQAAASVPQVVVVNGTSGNDRLSVNVNFDSRLEGGAGDDILTGGTLHHNKLIGGTGDDTYAVRGVGDVVVEGVNAGTDTVMASISYTLGANVENLRMAVGGLTGTGNELDNRIVGSSGNDRLLGMNGDDLIQGASGDDQIFGGNGDDDLRGDGGNDQLDGGAGIDKLSGGDGSDVLSGGTGNDILDGGSGSDTMTGGSGADVFKFRSADLGPEFFDTITDFARGTDKIDLRGIDARVSTSADDAFRFIGSAAFSGQAGELHWSAASGGITVSGDIDGDKIADFSIFLQSTTIITASDFVL